MDVFPTRLSPIRTILAIGISKFGFMTYWLVCIYMEIKKLKYYKNLDLRNYSLNSINLCFVFKNFNLH